MATIQDLETRVQNMLEEANDGAGIFWNLQLELRPLIVEGMNEAMLITGEPQVRQPQAFSLVASSSLQPMPPGIFAIIRVEGPNSLPLFATSLWDLETTNSNGTGGTGWENDTADAPSQWFPYGLSSWGIWPKVTQPTEVVVTGVGFPINVPRPYSGMEPVPFQEEYMEGFQDYVKSVASVKEGGQELQQGLFSYQAFLDQMIELSNFSYRKSSLRWTSSIGSTAGVTSVTRT